jgi:murein DD-endopeptidase MepM/ murein hydrolase activator NlpD
MLSLIYKLRKLVAAIFLSLVLIPSKTTLAGTESDVHAFRDYAPGVDMNTTKGMNSPTRDSSGNEIFHGVTSSWMQPRDVEGTSPHNGTDTAAPFDTALHPTFPGWIIYQSGNKTDGNCCVYDSNGFAKYEILLRLDRNGNKSQDDDVYLKYDHVHKVGFYANGAYVTPSDKIATSGNENGKASTHLHFGLLYPKDSGNNGRWTGLERHYTWASAWKYGDDLDLISFLKLNSYNQLYATIYVMDETNLEKIADGNVLLYHRKSGTSTWSYTEMKRTTSTGDRFTIDLDTLGYPSNTGIHYLIRAVRSGLSNDHKAGFFPNLYKHPDDNPNGATYAYPYYNGITQ